MFLCICKSRRSKRQGWAVPEEPGFAAGEDKSSRWSDGPLCQRESQNSVISTPASASNLWMIKSMSCYRHKTADIEPSRSGPWALLNALRHLRQAWDLDLPYFQWG